MKSFLFLCTIFYSLLVSAEDECLTWFKKSKLTPTSKDCLLNCSSLLTDMDTFHCPNDCQYFCKLPVKEKILFRYVYYPALTTSERALIAQHPKAAFTVFKQKNMAEKRTNLYFPQGFIDDESDAFRHFV